jgi:hypothetical protein
MFIDAHRFPIHRADGFVKHFGDGGAKEIPREVMFQLILQHLHHTEFHRTAKVLAAESGVAGITLFPSYSLFFSLRPSFPLHYLQLPMLESTIAGWRL